MEEAGKLQSEGDILSKYGISKNESKGNNKNQKH